MRYVKSGAISDFKVPATARKVDTAFASQGREVTEGTAGKRTSARVEEKVVRVRIPSTDGFGSYEARRLTVGLVAHQNRIAIRKVRGNLAVIGERYVGALLTKLDAVSVVLE